MTLTIDLSYGSLSLRSIGGLGGEADFGPLLDELREAGFLHRGQFF